MENLNPADGNENPDVIALPGFPVRLQRILAWSVLAIAVCWCFFNVWRYAVNIPYWDEWGIFNTIGQPWDQWFVNNNEHKIVFTRMLNELFYRINGLNIRSLILFNFFFYICVIAVIWITFHSSLRKFVWYPVFFVPFFSDMVSTNLLWSNQNQFHFLLLFAFAALIFGFRRKSSPFHAFLFGLFLVLDTFSMSFNFAIPLLAAYLVKEVLRFRTSRERSLRNLLACCLIPAVLLFAAVLIFLTWQPEPFFHPARSLLYPWDVRFWMYGVFSVYRVFSGTLHSSFFHYGLPAFLFFSVPLLAFACSLWAIFRERRFPQNFSAVGACLLMTLVSLCLILAVRQGTVSSRHLEALISLFLIVPAVLLTASFRQKTKRRLLFLFLVGIFLLLPHTMNFGNAKQFSAELTEGKKQWEWAVRNRERPLFVRQLAPGDLSEFCRQFEKKGLSWFPPPLPPRL